MQTARALDASPLARMERAVEAETAAAASVLTRRARLPQEELAAVVGRLRDDAWADLLSSRPPVGPEVVARRAGLRAAARVLRDRGLVPGDESGGMPLPEGLTAEALRGALSEVIPGRRSVAGLYLRGYGAEEMAVLYDLEPPEMRARVEEALDNLRSSLHRRAERMNVASWSQALESIGIEGVRGMLHRGSVPASRLQCTDPADQAEAVNGTHFRGGREGALDHAVTCDPCCQELRELFALRRTPRPEAGPDLDAAQLERLRREARSRPELRSIRVPAPAAGGHRRRWPWIVLALAGALLAWVLL